MTWIIETFLPDLDKSEMLNTLSNALDKVADAFKWLDEKITAWSESNSFGKEILLTLIEVIVKATLVIGTILVLIGWGTAIVGALTTAFTLLSAVFAFIMSPIGLVILAILAIIVVIKLLIDHWDEVVAFFTEKWITFKEGFDELVANFKFMVEELKEGMGILVGKIGEKLTLLKNAFVNTFIKVKSSVIGTFKAMANIIIGIWNGVINGFEKGLNFIIKGINKFASGINKIISTVNKVSKAMKLPTISARMGIVGNVSLGRIPKLERGGSLADGDLFRAGEYGKSELVGSFNNKTSVMPLENSGFVDAMYNAVFNAVSGANESGKGQIIENVLNLDGNVIYRNQQQVARDRGKNFNIGAFAR